MNTISIHTRRMIQSENRIPTNIGTNGFATPIPMFQTCAIPIGIDSPARAGPRGALEVLISGAIAGCPVI
jgi:hypothetical protein